MSDELGYPASIVESLVITLRFSLTFHQDEYQAGREEECPQKFQVGRRRRAEPKGRAVVVKGENQMISKDFRSIRAGPRANLQ